MKLDSIGNYQARSAWETLEYLDLHWPAEQSPSLEKAKRLCQEALDGMVDPEIARLAVIDAAQRAGLLEHGWKPQPMDHSAYSARFRRDFHQSQRE